MNYTIWSPQYVNYHAGVRALHILKDELIKRGHKATMHYEEYIEESFVVYPEITGGNPLGAKHFCHWYLLHRKPHTGLTFGWAKDMGSENLLTVNTVEKDIFYPRKNKREGVAFWVGKGSTNGFTIPQGAIEITKTYPDTREKLAELMASVEYVLSFDDYTGINLEAPCLGTPVLVQSKDSQASKAKMEQSGFPLHGVIFSIDDLDKAKQEVLQSYEAHKEFDKIFDERIDNFINITQAYF
jgi:hypothetical protein